jgi:hypothetical protein
MLELVKLIYSKVDLKNMQRFKQFMSETEVDFPFYLEITFKTRPF